MNWKTLQYFPRLDTRAFFVNKAPVNGVLLDLGSSDGETLGHIHELRPDLKLLSIDLEGSPANYPAGTEFHQANLESDILPWANNTIDIVTCMHLVEHLSTVTHLLAEVYRVLRPGGYLYVETPHPKTLALPSPEGCFVPNFTLNFYDDITHTKIVSMGALAKYAQRAGLIVQNSGTSRNWIFAAMWPVFACLRPSRKKYSARVHWIGWSSYIILKKPGV